MRREINTEGVVSRLYSDPAYAAAFIARYGAMLMDELNVKQIRMSGDGFAVVFPADSAKPVKIPEEKILAWLRLFPEDREAVI